MSTDTYKAWQATEIRRPRDVPAGIPLRWLAERHGEHVDRLMLRSSPADFPHQVERGDAGDALAELALGAEIERTVIAQRAGVIRRALTLGATWTEAAAALDTTPDAARELLRTWAYSQHRLYESDVAAGRHPIGLSEEAYTNVVDLLGMTDDERFTA